MDGTPDKAILTEHNRSPWLDPLYYGEGLADEAAAAATEYTSNGMEKGAILNNSTDQLAATTSATTTRPRHQHKRSSSARYSQGNTAAPLYYDDADFIGEKGPVPRYFSAHEKPQGGLIDFARNSWLKVAHPSSSTMTAADKAQSIRGWTYLKGSRPLRRSLLIMVVLSVIVYYTYSSMREAIRLHKEDVAILRSLDQRSKEKVGGWFGDNRVPQFKDVTLLKELDKSHLPNRQMAPEGQPSSKRLLVVGDVHGCFDELQELLNVANFSPEYGDHLVFTGGLIGGGPDSMKTIDLARKWNSSCVRGFAEDRVLLTRRKIKDVEHIIEEEEKHDTGRVKLAMVLGAEPGVMGEREIAERKLAKEMTDEQAAYLEHCPVILRLGELGDEKGDMGDVVVVHGGLVPGVSLENQDPSAVMTVRTVDTEMHVPYDSGVGVDWAKMFNKEQALIAAAREASSSVTSPSSPQDDIRKPITAIYGHTILDTPRLNRYTKGINTACYLGGKLSLFAIEDGGVNSVIQVACPERGEEDEQQAKSKKKRWFFL